MMIHELTPKLPRYKSRKRLGKGHGSGHGKTAGRGTKGAGSRSGWSGSIRAGREGGQMPLFRRVPKRGFTNAPFRKEFVVVNISDLDAKFAGGTEITAQSLVDVGLIHDTKTPVKVLGNGETSKKFSVKADCFSKSAEEKITKAGGSVTATAKVVVHRPKGEKKAKKAQ